jgi:hypothetical protein
MRGRACWTVGQSLRPRSGILPACGIRLAAQPPRQRHRANQYGIAEAQARRCENVPAPKRSAQPIDQTECPGVPIDNAVPDYVPFPGLRHELGGPCLSPHTALFNLPEVLQGLKNRLTGRHGAEANGAHQSREETSDAAVLRQQLVEVGIVRRSGQAVDLGHSASIRQGLPHKLQGASCVAIVPAATLSNNW